MGLTVWADGGVCIVCWRLPHRNLTSCKPFPDCTTSWQAGLVVLHNKCQIVISQLVLSWNSETGPSTYCSNSASSTGFCLYRNHSISQTNFQPIDVSVIRVKTQYCSCTCNNKGIIVRDAPAVFDVYIDVLQSHKHKHRQQILDKNANGATFRT